MTRLILNLLIVMLVSVEVAAESEAAIVLEKVKGRKISLHESEIMVD